MSVAKDRIFEELENPNDCRCTQGDEISSDRSACALHDEERLDRLFQAAADATWSSRTPAEAARRIMGATLRWAAAQVGNSAATSGTLITWADQIE